MSGFDPFSGLSDHGAAFARTIQGVHGAVGRAWLDRLPALLLVYAERWSLRLLPPFPLSYHYVAPVQWADNTDAVLKAGPPTLDRCRELLALQAFDGHGMARLLAFDLTDGVALIERVQPGHTLAGLDDETATSIAAAVMQQLWQTQADALFPEFPTIQQWGEGFARLRTCFNGGTGPLPAAWVDRAEHIFAELTASAAAPTLLHGDLHHFNLLAGQRSPWLAIDPQGVIGEPAYEVGALLRNPFEPLPAHADLVRFQARRVDQLAELLNLDRQRLAGWGMAQAVLSACWDVEDNVPGFAKALAYADALACATRSS